MKQGLDSAAERRATDRPVTDRLPAQRPAMLPGVVSRRSSPTGMLALQRSAGNAAVAGAISGPRVPSLQRIRVDLPAGGGVGDEPATNHREAVRLVLDQLHVLWGIDNPTYDAVYPKVSGLAPGEKVSDPEVLKTVQAALVRLAEPVLPAEVATAQYAAPIGAGVGAGQPNRPDDVHKVQDVLKVNAKIDSEAYKTESAVTGALSAANLPQTFAGITALKLATVTGRGKQGWSPLIRSDEGGGDGPGGDDRLADQTFQYQDFMLFVPAGATTALTNNVHVFFSAGGVTGAGSHTEHHGLRGTADQGARILIGVQGRQGQAFTISEGQVTMALESAGRPARIDSLTLSAHSRGNAGLAKTLRERLLPSGLIQHITVLDGNDQAKSLKAAFKIAGIPMSKISAEIVNTGGKDGFGPRSHSVQMDPAAVRAIGYARLIEDAEALGRGAIPPAVAGLAAALGLPPRGTFTVETPPAPGRVDFRVFARAHAAQLAALRTGEVFGAKNVQQLAGAEESSPYVFIEWQNLLNISDRVGPRSDWRVIQPGIYAHHLFVAELGGDFLL